MYKKQFAIVTAFVLVLGFAGLAASAASKSVTIRVEGMHCGGCASSVAKALKATQGVEDVRVSFEKGEAWVQYDDQKVTEAKLREVINSTGFRVVDEKPSS
jgi:copper chaperone CopZ